MLKSLNKNNNKTAFPPNRRISYLCIFWGRTLSSRRDGWVCSWSCSPRTLQTRYSFCCFPEFGWWSNDQTLDRSMGSLSLTQCQCKQQCSDVFYSIIDWILHMLNLLVALFYWILVCGPLITWLMVKHYKATLILLQTDRALYHMKRIFQWNMHKLLLYRDIWYMHSALLCTFDGLPLGQDGDCSLCHLLLVHNRRDLWAPAVWAHPDEMTCLVGLFSCME